MSHELRTPLSGALGTLRLLSATELDTQQREYLQIINAANLSLLDIVSDILGYSQLEAGKLNIDNRRFNLRQLLDNVTGLMRVSAGEKNNRLILQTDEPEANWLMGDSGKLHQILINLVGNANKFTDNGTIILKVDCRQADGGKQEVHFAVIDSGIGIAADKQEDIFQAFTQVDASSSRRYGGIGLGLAICERLVHAMGGRISLDSQLGKGTNIGFTVDFDVCEIETSDRAGDISMLYRGEGIDVLMVEDDATNSMVTRRYLEHLGHRVLAAESGERALELLDGGGASLVLLDISLPGIDGLAILRYIREHADEAVSRLPVIAMSAHVFTEEVDQYLAAGMDGFLGKPFSLEDLQQAIERVIQGGITASASDVPGADSQGRATFDSSPLDEDIQRLGLDSVEQLVDLFFQSAEQLREGLRVAMQRGDSASIEKLAHRLNSELRHR